MDDKNVVKKRVTLAIAFAVFIVVAIAVILLIKPVMSKVQENRTAKVSQETAQEAEEFLKTKETGFYSSIPEGNTVVVAKNIFEEVF